MSFILEQYSNRIYSASLNLDIKQIASKIYPIKEANYMVDFVCWAPDTRKVAYICKNIDNYSIRLKDLNSDEEQKIIEDQQRKFRLSFLPDGESLSYISIALELWELPIIDGTPKIIYPRSPGTKTLNIYNYCWGKTSEYLYAIVSIKDSSNWGEIVKLNLNNQNVESVFRKIKSPNESVWELRLSPDKSKLGIRCGSEENSKYVEIHIIDISNQTEKLVMTVPGIIPFGEISWTADSQFLIFGAYTENHEFNIYYYSVKNETVNIFSSRPLTEMYWPGQVSPKGDEIILYVEKDDSNIWMLSEN